MSGMDRELERLRALDAQTAREEEKQTIVARLRRRGVPEHVIFPPPVMPSVALIEQLMRRQRDTEEAARRNLPLITARFTPQISWRQAAEHLLHAPCVTLN